MAKRPQSSAAKTGKARQAPSAARRGGMRHVAPAAAAAARPALRRRGLAVAGVISEWRNIAGAFLAGSTAPEKLVAGRALPGGGRDAGVLHLRVGSPALAPEIAHLAPQIIEKVNGYFGYRAVARLRILHAPVAGPFATGPSATGSGDAAPRDATPDEKAATRRRTAAVADPELRAALQRLGEAIAARQDR